MHDFLSPEWVAAADDIHTRYRGRAPEIPVSVRINMTITDVPFGDDPSIGAFIDTTGGEMLFRIGQLDEADVTVITDYEVAKAIALGADACSIGRAYLYGLGAAGEPGVDHVLRLLRSGIERTMALTGRTSLAEIDRDLVRWR